MYKTSRVAKVIDENCVGCTVCANVCPSGAITMVDRLAVVEESKCTGCFKCTDACLPYGAIQLADDPNPKSLGFPREEWDLAAVDELCAKARLDPNMPVCVCTGTTAGEVAAAVANGVHEPEELTLETGVRSVCSIWCLSAVMRLLDAKGVPPERPAKDYRVYTDTVTDVAIWNISDEVADKYPEHFLSQDRAAVDAGELELAGTIYFPTIGRRPGS